MECKSQSLVPYQLGDTPLLLAHLGGFEPPAHGLEVRCSIQLSYRCLIGAGEGNRTLATSLEGWGSTTELHPQILSILQTKDLTSTIYDMSFKDKTFFGGDERIRTTESKANGFTVRPIWPTLEHPQILNLWS